MLLSIVYHMCKLYIETVSIILIMQYIIYKNILQYINNISLINNCYPLFDNQTYIILKILITIYS